MKHYFHNKSIIDPRAWEIMGLNAKEKESAIGFFGTGLKYAIAQIVGDGGTIKIESGGKEFNFGKKQIDFRGKELQVITCEDKELGFTNELGKTWLPWMIFRELLCNAKDEDGGYSEQVPTEYGTLITVNWPAFDQVKSEMHKHFLRENRTPTLRLSEVNVYSSPSPATFYQGIKINEQAKSWLFTYEITSKLNLSEDRTVDSYIIKDKIASSLCLCTDLAILRKVIACHKNYEESNLCFNYQYSASEEFIQVISEKHKADEPLQPGLKSLWKIVVGKDIDHKVIPFSAKQSAMLKKAKDLLSRCGYTITNNIELVVIHNDNLFGQAYPDKIILTSKAFDHGMLELFQTLLEEHFHQISGLSDETRAFQEFILRKLANALLDSIDEVI